ncbi:membrane-targeted effector domain-containing toxin [Pseudomonas putida]|uniref:Multifunctional autoprocessing RTX toxin-like protein n=1 Tax=Pseudomonas putida TaxID=303 RepID=A0A9X8HJM6_PSEPU|nr:membrane-targeted effector domain-containing toxin [Pseudomonas putida]ROQ49810.1 multifunctional autoprocessing RTX toxin-like protein [Pseudomonas putida]
MPLTAQQTHDHEQLQNLARQLVKHCPDMRQMARDIASHILKKHTRSTLDPDAVYLHRFNTAHSSPRTFSGWEHLGPPSESLTLPQLVMQRFDVNDQDNADLLGYRTGFYSRGPGTGLFDERDEVPMAPREVLDELWKVDFCSAFHQDLTRFWARHSDNFRTLAKANFLSKVLETCAHQTDPARLARLRRVATALAGDASWPPSLSQLQQQARPVAGVRLCTFDIGGHVATDILRVELDDGYQLLYIPGEVDALHLFANHSELYWWVLHNTNAAQNRARFMTHFALADRGEKASAVGLEHLIDVLFNNWGGNGHDALNQSNTTVHGDGFTHLRDAARQRMIDDANFSLRSNADLRKQLWIGYLKAFGTFASAMAAVDWPVALAAVGAGLAETGLNIDQAVNGHTTAQRKAGVIGAVLAAINTLFNATLLAGPAVTGEIAEIEPSLDAGTQTAPVEPEHTPMATPAELAEWAPAPLIPAERSQLLAPFETNVLLDGHATGSGKFQGIYTLDDGFYAQIDGFPYHVRYIGELRSWAVVDPQNPYSFYRNVPIGLNDEGVWQPLEQGLKGGAPRFRLKLWGQAQVPAPGPERVPTPYEVDKALQPELLKASNGGEESNLSGRTFSPNNPAREQAYAQFRTLRDLLVDDAEAFFSTASLPQRPPLPTLAADASARQIIRSVYENSEGLVVGEAHSQLGSKQFLIENMALLKQQKVRVLYMEHLMTDFQQADLDLFNQTGQMPQALKTYVTDLDRGWHTDPAQRYTFMQVLRSAQKQGIRIQAIDCMASYRQAWMGPRPPAIRQKMMNFFAHRVIAADQAAHGAGKWVALMGNTHANTFESVPGVSELQGVIGVRVEDIEIGSSASVGRDPGLYAVDDGIRETRVQGDLRLQVPIAQPPSASGTLESRLAKPGAFGFKDIDGKMTLVHRSKDLALHYTPIARDGEFIYIERASWPWLDKRRLPDLSEMAFQLSRYGLKYVPL